MGSLRTSSVVAVAAGFIACGQAFSEGVAADGGPDAASGTDAAGDAARGRFCSAAASAVGFCDDFDDRTSGIGPWTLDVSTGGTLAIDSTSSVSAPHALVAKAASTQNAVYGFNVPATSKVVLDFSIKVEKIAVATSAMRFVSLGARDNPNAFRLDLVKSVGNTYELRTIVNGEAIGESLPLDGLSAIESGWHRVTWTTIIPTFSTTYKSGEVQIKLDDKNLGKMSIDLAAQVTVKDVAEAFRTGLRLFVGAVAPAGQSEVEVRYDNVTVTGS